MRSLSACMVYVLDSVSKRERSSKGFFAFAFAFS